MDEPAKLSDIIAANLQLGIEEKQELLGIFDPAARLARIADVLDVEIEKLDLDRNIQSRVKRQMERAQKEYYLNEKIKAIQKELGRGEKNEFDELRKKIESAGMPKEVLDKAIQELKKLEAMPPMSAESTVSRNYIDWLLAVPWKKRSKETRSIDFAEKVLNEDHYGLEKIKERILEFLAVRQLVKNPKGSILCFVGPPGVGKTSLGMSIAKATGRKFVRMSLGGVRDEAEIRGHRRTYIGALPGRLVRALRDAGTMNPVILLDEVDKKVAIARGYLWPRQRERAGLREEEVSIDDITLELIVSQYTREAGVRQLERELGKLLRKTATTVASGTAEPPISLGDAE